MVRVTLYRKCPQCHGTQFFQPSSGEGSEPIPCNWPGCSQGHVENGGFILDTEPLMNKLDEILGKLNEILEEVQE